MGEAGNPTPTAGIAEIESRRGGAHGSIHEFRSMKQIGDCRLCGGRLPLVDSHVVPKAFLAADTAKPEAARMISSDASTYPRRVPSGVYGQFVCSACETGFGKYDTYAYEYLYDEKAVYERIGGDEPGDPRAFSMPLPDYAKLKLFFMVTLWRAHWCSHDFYREVRLGASETRLREMIVNEDAGSPDEFAVVLSTFDDATLGSIQLDPRPEGFRGVRSYRFYMGRFIASIKDDPNPYPMPFRNLQITPDRRPIVIARDILSSPELRVALKGIGLEEKRRSKRF